MPPKSLPSSYARIRTARLYFGTMKAVVITCSTIPVCRPTKVAEMVVDMQYTAPAEKQFRIVSQNGMRLLVNRVLKELLENEKEALDEQNQSRTRIDA